TKMAQAMVTIYDLHNKLGNVRHYDPSGQQGFFMDKPYSDDTAKIIDEEISVLIEGQYERAKNLLQDNKDKLDQLAQKLLEKEVIFRDDLELIFGKRPFDKDSSVDDDASSISKEMKNNKVQPETTESTDSNSEKNEDKVPSQEATTNNDESDDKKETPEQEAENIE
ncbi:MAG: hypothetical protein HON99_01505, partial [Crocinitomicaceae bacterium]|nr:hypothetical protein [Crocinitomicaceae bacterium]